MVEIGKKYTGTQQYGFQGIIEVLEFNPETNYLRVKLTNKNGTSWEETWSLQDFEYGLSTGGYVEIVEHKTEEGNKEEGAE